MKSIILIALGVVAAGALSAGKYFASLVICLIMYWLYNAGSKKTNSKTYAGGGGCPYCGGELYPIHENSNNDRDYSLKCKNCRTEFP